MVEPEVMVDNFPTLLVGGLVFLISIVKEEKKSADFSCNVKHSLEWLPAKFHVRENHAWIMLLKALLTLHGQADLLLTCWWNPTETRWMWVQAGNSRLALGCRSGRCSSDLQFSSLYVLYLLSQTGPGTPLPKECEMV